jgi:hypothetical protein
MNKIILTLALSVVWSSTALAGNLEMTAFTGQWEVDFDRTMEEVKKSPKYDEAMAEQMPAIVKRMMSKMKIKITDQEMIYLLGTKEMALPYSVTSSDTESVTVSIQQGPEEVAVAFTLIEGQCMNFKSSASDDMHFYVWKRSAGKKEQE